MAAAIPDESGVGLGSLTIPHQNGVCLGRLAIVEEIGGGLTGLIVVRKNQNGDGSDTATIRRMTNSVAWYCVVYSCNPVCLRLLVVEFTRVI